MYLEKVEIHGFKSFGNAVKMTIPKGITAVIGPNGSGKSNVADAIRWVLGEQSAKSLRGSRMEDIIFAGTDKRKSLGYAEVSLTLKNPDNKLPIAYTEVVVKRRVYRSGESEYFINGSTCRLKDVQELFMDTGIGKDGYSIIGQGQIDRVLSSKPEERRTLFEEAAGIYKYKVRRVEAERKLEKQRDNLMRVEDIIIEIESRLGPLEIEAEKTTRFLKLKEQLKEVDLNIFIAEIDRLEVELKSLDEVMTAVEVQVSETLKEQEAQSIKRTTYKAQKDELYREIERLIETISNLEKSKEKKESQIVINEEKGSNIERLLEGVRQDQRNQEADNKNKQERVTLLESKRTALEIEYASKEAVIVREEEKLNAVLEKLKKLEESIDSSRKELYNKTREIDLLDTELKKNDGLEEQLDYRKEQIKEQIALLNSEIQHQEVSLQVIEKNKKETGEVFQQKSELLKTREVATLNLEKHKIDLEGQLNKAEQNKGQTARQLKWLQHIKEENEGFFASVKQVLNIKKAESAKWQGIIGVVGEILEVPKAYEIAIVTALGGAVQNIVTATEQDAKQMIEVMKRQGIGRVTFLPKDTVRPAYPINEQGLRSEEGFLGFANELVTYDQAYNHIISSLLGRILIIDNMHNASRIAKTYQYKYKLVTLEGEVFNSGGSLSGGSVKNQSNNIFSRGRELKETEEKLQGYEAHIEKLTCDLQEITKQLETSKSECEDLKKQCEAYLVSLKGYELEEDKLTHALKLTKNNQLQLISERNNIEETLEGLEAGKSDIYEKLEVLKETMGSDENELLVLEEELTSVRKQKDALGDMLTERRISLSTTEQNMKYAYEQIKELKEALESFNEKTENIERTIQKYLEEKVALVEQNKMIKASIIEEETRIKEGQNQRKQLDFRKEEIEKEESKLAGQTSEITQRLDRLKEEKYRLETKRQSSMIQKQNWGTSMWEQYEMTYNQALEFKMDNISISDLKKQSAEMKANIKMIGNVNVNAVEEYKETKKRCEFLSHQKEDMQKAEQTLLEMIDSLMEQMKVIFKVQFEQIAENFTLVFKELFGGGEAYLQLVDEENILESGIEIIAKPPGKKLQNMSLLSGGERALTAISLIFGILRLKPSPFCVLDEIEAALDDANVLRFANYLEQLSDETQFIVITHRKGTMERAHTLYGVTMQERGVSTVLSIQLQEAQKYIDKKTS